MKLQHTIFVLLLTLLPATQSLAKSISEEAEQRIRAVFGPQQKIQIKNYKTDLIEISSGSKTVFASLDGRYIFAGPILDTENRVNIIEQKDMQYRKQRLADLKPTMYLSYPAATEERHTVTLFTDIDCTYCRRFHSSMDKYNELGITINYVMLPRAGLNSPSYNKAASVFCSSDPSQNMTLAMKDEFFEKNNCEHTITEQLQLAMEFGISSTPTMVLPDGTKRVGIQTPENLLKIITQIK